MTYVLKRSAGGHAARYVAGRAPSVQRFTAAIEVQTD